MNDLNEIQGLGKVRSAVIFTNMGAENQELHESRRAGTQPVPAKSLEVKQKFTFPKHSNTLKN